MLRLMLGLRGFWNTNFEVLVTRKSHIGGHAQYDAQLEKVGLLLEYRLNFRGDIDTL